jgi:hypothetical protein
VAMLDAFLLTRPSVTSIGRRWLRPSSLPRTVALSLTSCCPIVPCCRVSAFIGCSRGRDVGCWNSFD